jgi:hypothetical protein
MNEFDALIQRVARMQHLYPGAIFAVSGAWLFAVRQASHRRERKRYNHRIGAAQAGSNIVRRGGG